VSNPFDVVRQFEAELCRYTGARYAVTATSCTAALLMALAWCKRQNGPQTVEIPKRTYVGVGMSILNAGHGIAFRDEIWHGEYRLQPFPLWDSARRLTGSMFRPGHMQCLSFHWTKHLSVSQAGAILHDDPEADVWLRRARFDGRREGVHPKDDTFDMVGFHCYIAGATAAEGLMRLSVLPKHNADLPNSDYSDLSKAPIFGGRRLKEVADAAE
jgi:dTDP-4-amino-4,6-dideoxygalactose transaminase